MEVVVADSFLSRSLFLFLLLSGQSVVHTFGVSVGINYGQIANNLPSPARVAALLHSLGIRKVKLYDADPNVLSAFRNTDVEFVVGIGNEHVAAIADPAAALSWLQQHVRPHIPATRITCITVGNEVVSGNDTALKSSLLPAMQSVHQALASLGLDEQINVTTAHSLDVLASSFPPSSGSFREDYVAYIQPLLGFLSSIKSPFLVNAYPYFAYKSSPGSVSLDYVLFRPNSGVTDPNTALSYDNMLYAQIDSVYAAMRAVGHADVDISISETGWPSGGDPDEEGATPENAAAYNGNLLQRIAMNQGTPMRPSTRIDIYVFALFNENLKPGPASERNYGLFYPDGVPVYNIGLRGNLPMLVSSSNSMVISWLQFYLFVIAVMMLML